MFLLAFYSALLFTYTVCTFVAHYIITLHMYVCTYVGTFICWFVPQCSLTHSSFVCCTGVDNQRDFGHEGEQAEEHSQLLGQLPGWGHGAMGEGKACGPT